MSPGDSYNPAVQYPEGFQANRYDKLVGFTIVHSDANGTLQKVAPATPLPVSITGSVIITATGLATQATLAAILAAQATAANQTSEISALNSIISALTGTSGSFASVADFTVPAAGVAAQGAVVATPRGVVLTALMANTKQVYVGTAGVTNSGGGQEGMVLYTGQQTPTIMVASLSQIWLNADVNNEGCGVLIL